MWSRWHEPALPCRGQRVRDPEEHRHLELRLVRVRETRPSKDRQIETMFRETEGFGGEIEMKVPGRNKRHFELWFVSLCAN